MHVAALDLGTNTFLLLIADVENGQFKKVFCDESTVTRLGEGIYKTHRFGTEALKRAEQCLKAYAKKINEYQCKKIIAAATSAARDVKNGEELIRIGALVGIPIRIISGEVEAQTTYSGAMVGLNNNSQAAVIDVGGGSTEFIGPNEMGKVIGVSVNIGSVRLTEMFLSRHPCRSSEVVEMENYVRDQLKEHSSEMPQHPSQLIAVAGTPTTLACLELGQEFEEDKVHGFVLGRAKIIEWRDRLAVMSLEERIKLSGMQPKRADVIVAGLTILALGSEFLDVSKITVSTKGVRFGLAGKWESFS